MKQSRNKKPQFPGKDEPWMHRIKLELAPKPRLAQTGKKDRPQKGQEPTPIDQANPEQHSKAIHELHGKKTQKGRPFALPELTLLA